MNFYRNLWKTRKNLRHMLANDVAAQILWNNSRPTIGRTLKNLCLTPRAIYRRFVFLRISHGYCEPYQR